MVCAGVDHHLNLKGLSEGVMFFSFCFDLFELVQIYYIPCALVTPSNKVSIIT